VGRNGGVGPVLEALRFRKIVLDALAARFQNRAYARQRNSRHQQIKRDESQREPEQLGRKGVRVERRKSFATLAPGNVLDRGNRLRTLLSHRQTPNLARSIAGC
jgi:hypothetical protein